MAEVTLAPIPVADLTEAKTDGVGVFDVLMQANKAHLDEQFALGRFKGAEYSTVYLGSLQAVMNTALEFLLRQRKDALESELLAQQIELAKVQVQKAEVELEILNLSKPKVAAEIANIEADTALTEQKTINAVTENLVLVATECKLRAEYDVLMQQKLKVAAEVTLLAQKTATEKAQTQSAGVDEDSVIGKQKVLYTRQAEGFVRDAEQKAAKILIDTWNVRRTTDEGTVADVNNKLYDASIGRVVEKLLSGAQA